MSSLNAGSQAQMDGPVPGPAAAPPLTAPVPRAAEVLSRSVRGGKSLSALGRRRIEQRRVLVTLLAIADLCVLVLALRLAQWTYASPLLPQWLQPGPKPSLLRNLPLWLAIVMPVLKFRGLYRFRYRDGLYSIERAAVSILLSTAIFAVLVFFLDWPTYRAFVVLLGAYSLVLFVAMRLIFRVMAMRLPPLSRRVLVVGSGNIASSTARMISQYRRRGLYLVSPDDITERADNQEARQDDVSSHPFILDTSDVRQIATYIHALDVDDVVITREWYARHCPDVEHAFTILNQLPAQVHVAPNPPELMMRMSVEDFSGLPVVSLSSLTLPRWQLVIKRAIDLLASVVLIVLLGPLMLVTALAIRVTTPGPALFKQLRVGQYHRLFVVYKFRTMYSGEHAVPATGPHKRPGDPRVTPLGRWLRRLSLDEFPQLFNVLRGEMSLVGPRPELPAITSRYQPWQYGRLLVPPGMTGWWQVNGRGERILHEHTEDDIYYVRNFSLVLDARIVLMTLRAMLTGRGAF